VLLAGALIFLAVFMAGSNMAALYNSWNAQSGRFWSAVSEAGLYPLYVIAIIAMLAGVALLVLGNREKP
jgi:hypothetical protein